METYTGGCHCGKVKYDVTTDLKPLIACNCSICSRHGLVLTFVKPEQFKLKAGDGALTEYQFNMRKIHHYFCPSCGVESFARGSGKDGGEQIAINVRCLDGVDITTLKPTPFDGKSL